MCNKTLHNSKTDVHPMGPPPAPGLDTRPRWGMLDGEDIDMYTSIEDLLRDPVSALSRISSSGVAHTLTIGGAPIGALSINDPSGETATVIADAVKRKRILDAGQIASLEAIFQASDLNQRFGIVTRRAEESSMPIGITKNNKPWLVIVKPWWIEEMLSIKFDWVDAPRPTAIPGTSHIPGSAIVGSIR